MQIFRKNAVLLAVLVLSGCSDKDMADSDGSGGNGGNGGSGGSSAQTLCAKYGGPENIATVVSKYIITDSIAADCRISSFFTVLGEESFHRVNDCLTIQVQELFGCEGIQYEGAMSRDGLACRSMEDAHAGVGISSADFDALIEDVVQGLQTAGVEQADIDAAAPALLGLKDTIVENPSGSNGQSICVGGAGGGGGGGAGG